MNNIVQIGLGAAAALAVVVISETPSYSFKSQEDYVEQCQMDLFGVGLSAQEIRAGCDCMYTKGRATAEARGEYAITDQEAELFSDQCFGVFIQSAEARADWEDDGGWGR